jgi:hypothetical protein
METTFSRDHGAIDVPSYLIFTHSSGYFNGTILGKLSAF